MRHVDHSALSSKSQDTYSTGDADSEMLRLSATLPHQSKPGQRELRGRALVLCALPCPVLKTLLSAMRYQAIASAANPAGVRKEPHRFGSGGRPQFVPNGVRD